MEATMEVDQKDPELNEWQTFTKARFVMVSRDPMNKGSAIVNRLVAETDEEKNLFQKGEGKKKKIDLFILASVVRNRIDRWHPGLFLFIFEWSQDSEPLR